MNVLVYGAGQLAQMMQLAALPLGIKVQAVDVGNNQVVDAISKTVSSLTLQQAIEQADVLTAEFEHVPEDLLAQATESGKLKPSQGAILVGADRVREKHLLTQLNIPNCEYSIVDDVNQLPNAVDLLGEQLVIKASRDGYDGYGQWRLADRSELADLQHELGALDLKKVPLVVEKMTRFDRELSLIGARNQQGQIEFYPLAENLHHQGQLHLSVAPAPKISETLQAAAESDFTKLVEALDYVGVMAVEFFQCGEQLLVNEIAPRVHNSGHWSQCGAVASQFENHIRAVCGLPLLSGKALQPSAMINVIGYEESADTLRELPNAQLHWYGKTARVKRKMGHINVTASSYNALAERLEVIAQGLPKDTFPVLGEAISAVLKDLV